MSQVGTHSDLIGLFTWHHFQLYNINYGFLFALWAVKGEPHKDSFLINLDSCFAAANRAANPKRIIWYVIHRNSSKLYGSA